MALRRKILASGVFLFSVSMLSITADTVIPDGMDKTHSSETLIGWTETKPLATTFVARQPDLAPDDLSARRDGRNGPQFASLRSFSGHGSDALLAASHIRWSQIFSNQPEQKPEEKLDLAASEIVPAATVQAGITSVLPAPHVSPHEIGSVVECVSQAVAGEARGEVDTGQVGVANVIVNRLKVWGGSYCARVYARRAGVCQFDGACHGKGIYTHEVVGRARSVAFAAVTGQLHDVTGGALYFRVCQPESERDPSFTVRIQNHCYFKDLPGLSREDARARSRKIAEEVAARVGVKEVRSIPIIHVDYAIVPDKNSRYGFRVDEAKRT